MLLKLFKTLHRGNARKSTKAREGLRSGICNTVKTSVLPTPLSGRRLHIGGHVVQADWEIFDAILRSGVDHVGNANDLTRFPDETFAAVYASHVLEHFECFQVVTVLREWNRVLIPGGLLYVSVPDLDALSTIILDKHSSTLQQRFDAIRMLFGGQTDSWDYHKVGLNEEVLIDFLKQAGMTGIQRASNFGFFTDTSTLVFLQRPISLNIVASKPK